MIPLVALAMGWYMESPWHVHLFHSSILFRIKVELFFSLFSDLPSKCIECGALLTCVCPLSVLPLTDRYMSALGASYGRPYWKMYQSEPEETPFCYGVTDRLFRLERADGLTGSRVRDDTSILFSISTAVDDEVKMACRQLYEAQSNERRQVTSARR